MQALFHIFFNSLILYCFMDNQQDVHNDAVKKHAERAQETRKVIGPLVHLFILLIMNETNKSYARGKNIKIYDKIKLKHFSTDYRLHVQQRQLKNGSYNQGIGCHKAIDETDWFIVLKPGTKNKGAQQSSLSYHFQYEDVILLNSTVAKKYLHVTSEFESEISKNYEVSLCDNGDGGPSCAEDEWIIKKVSNTQDNYWRVGQQIIIQSVVYKKPLCSHRKKLKETGDNEVFVWNQHKQSETAQKKGNEVPTDKKNMAWIVSEIQPFIYSSNLTDKKQVKQTQQIIEMNRLKQMKQGIKRQQSNPISSTNDLLRFGNERIRQIEQQQKKMQQQYKKKSCWRKYFCCCCPEDHDGYSSIN